MKTLSLAILFGLLLSPVVTIAQTEENPLPRCQQLAYNFAENPDSLKEAQLKQLQFCINQILAEQEATNPPTMLKGTIIEPLLPSEGDLLPASLDPPIQDLE